ncbi:ParB/RepB/Spo0J family partition protein [Myxococcus sp. CA051A]|uniref:ParB/RepB/Spo0J family partition protein n=1 Tax=Myxococcus llanfairpwllgwyngyllgogerychwyrndrobwllllantysiliogogogochensis TaxID=2590453 RepID=A0A540X3L7_9BACT|nr:MULTISPECIES: ParB/RepB/Spo0J family partition protein [Myxococcus]NTX05971.1 ParB/RepB/Spo0J family partition protein [Myxococcus sp. CA040A]NTX10585.1 ParB/RepB/Spo0J family partition protein [Myxococcus sp. CA056]NTX38219.1 ParB/RepB/Spo0J family partition protein [Myxococcus sp. CA033]NTX52800.1 ParB/RepB/Spo0J family partition protein [Myxococcus sp. CA039A]NTX63368.1 ParB/RepB/Spo0J family partition protein [Myxococcus sp. CA051A]
MVKADTQKRALGRGLSALIPQAAPGKAAEQAALKAGVLKLPIEAIHRDKDQPRRYFDEEKLKELTESIKTQGILQPILVRKDGDGGYKLIAGERRWRASQAAGLKEVPAIIKDVTEVQAFELALVENLQRADLNPIEEAEGYKRLTDEFRLTQEQVSQRVGKERSTVANALRLLALPADVKLMVADGSLSMGHARALLGVPRLPELQNLAKQVADKKLSVRDTERLVQQSRTHGKKDAGKTPPKQSPQVKSLVEELQRRLGTKVRLTERSPGKGTIEVDFFSYDDLDRLLKLLRKE